MKAKILGYFVGKQHMTSSFSNSTGGWGDKCPPCLALRALMPRRLQFSSRMRRQYFNTCTVATYKRTTKIGLQNVIKRLQFRARGVIAVSNQYALIANYQGQNLRRCTASERARSRTHARTGC